MKTDLAYFEINTMCNLNCIHCFNRSGMKHEYMTFQDFQKIANFFLQNDDITIVLAGGEPLVHPHIDQFLSFLNEPQNKRNGVCVVTNGILARKILTPYLLQEKPFTIQISLDGATEATNSFIRGPGHFDQVVSYMNFLSAHGYYYGMTRMTINNVNYPDIERFFYLSVERKFFPTFSFVVRSGNADDNWDDLNVPYTARLRCIELINRLYEINESEFKNISNLQILRRMNIHPAQRCSLMDPLADVHPLIKVNGDMQPCQRLYDKIYTLGNCIKEHPFDVFCEDNERLKAIRQIVQSREILLKHNLCDGCAISRECHCGCLGRAIDNCGTIMGLDADCNLRIAEFISRNVSSLFGAQ